MIVHARLGRPSYAATVIEGFDAVLLNTAVPRAADPVGMARAFGKAVDAGREAFSSGMLERRYPPTIGRAVYS
ncbi:hypothetical protein X773_22950 [Mesorhizobium sp. LSJC285A00]|nr:hypothetical protein X773_22950 [Mesorhizobium sp. LSJC285A00]